MVDFYGKYMDSMGRFFCIPTVDTTKRKHKIHTVPIVDNRAEVNLTKTCQKTSKVFITFPSSSEAPLPTKKTDGPWLCFLNLPSRQAANPIIIE